MDSDSVVEAIDELTAAQRFQIVELARQTQEVDGQAPLNEAGQLALNRSGGGAMHVLVHRGDDLLGYGQLLQQDPSPNHPAATTGQLFVEPSHRAAGIGEAIVAEMLRNTKGPLQIWALGNRPGAQELARKAGFTADRELLIMKSPLTAPFKKPVIPQGFEIRPFRVGADEVAWLEVNARAFTSHPEQGRMTLDDLHQRMAEPWFDPAGFFVAVRIDNGAIVGFHWTKRQSVVLGEVYVIGVDPTVESRGLGKALLLTGLRHLRERRLADVLLYVEGDHQRAIGLYESFGFTVSSRDVMYAHDA